MIASVADGRMYEREIEFRNDAYAFAYNALKINNNNKYLFNVKIICLHSSSSRSFKTKRLNKSHLETNWQIPKNPLINKKRTRNSNILAAS